MLGCCQHGGTVENICSDVTLVVNQSLFNEFIFQQVVADKPSLLVNICNASMCPQGGRQLVHEEEAVSHYSSRWQHVITFHHASDLTVAMVAC